MRKRITILLVTSLIGTMILCSCGKKVEEVITNNDENIVTDYSDRWSNKNSNKTDNNDKDDSNKDVIETESQSTENPSSIVVKNQNDFVTALNGTYKTITFELDDTRTINIPEGNYDIDLIINAPKSDVKNHGTFKSITIKAIAANTWYEYAKGNVIYLTSGQKSRILVDKDASIEKLFINGDKADVSVNTEGTLKKVYIDAETKVLLNTFKGSKIDEINVYKKTKLEIKADEPESIIIVNVTKDADGSVITSNNPIEVNTVASIAISLLKGAEDSRINTTSDARISLSNSTTNKKLPITVDGTLQVQKTETTKPVENNENINTGNNNNNDNNNTQNTENKPDNSTESTESNKPTDTEKPEDTNKPTGPHTHDYKKISDTKTCTESGVITYKCSCGSSYVEDSFPTGHNLDSNGKCSICGYACQHTRGWIYTPNGRNSNNKLIHTLTCNGCSYTKTEVCSFQGGKCTGCDQVCLHEITTKTDVGDTHSITCIDCGNTSYENHSYGTSMEAKDTHEHYKKCECGSISTESHAFINGSCFICGFVCPHTDGFAYFYKDGESVHSTVCEKCYQNAHTESHNFINGSCVCGATQ